MNVIIDGAFFTMTKTRSVFLCCYFFSFGRTRPVFINAELVYEWICLRSRKQLIVFFFFWTECGNAQSVIGINIYFLKLRTQQNQLSNNICVSYTNGKAYIPPWLRRSPLIRATRNQESITLDELTQDYNLASCFWFPFQTVEPWVKTKTSNLILQEPTELKACTTLQTNPCPSWHAQSWIRDSKLTKFQLNYMYIYINSLRG